MARTRISTREPNPFSILKDQPNNGDGSRESTDELVLDDKEVSDEETAGSDTSDASEASHRVIPRSVLEDIAKFEDDFPDIATQYRLIDRIGEGYHVPLYCIP